MFPFSRKEDRVRREAADWMAKLANDPDGDTRREFERWRGSDPLHAEAYARLGAIWSGSARLTRPQPIRNEGRHRLAFAGGLALLFGGVICLTPLGPFWTTHNAVLISTDGQQKTVTLADGSQITLAPGSRAEAKFDRSTRRVAMRQGGARFVIARERRPFIVEVGEHEVVADGSRLYITTGAERSTVTPLEGTVEVRSMGLLSQLFDEERTVAPGEKLLLEEGGLRIERADLKPASRATAMIEFDNVRLDEAVERFNRSSDTKLRVAGEIAGLRISGAHRAGDSNAFANSLAAAFSLRLDRQADSGILLSRSR